MIDEIMNFLRNKKIAILGFGLEGKSSYNFIRKHMREKMLTIICEEECEEEKKQILEKDKFVTFVTGENYLENLEQYDIILKTPGISFKNLDISKFKDKITSQLEFFLEYKKCMTIGVTGTKGKSTTSTLLYEVLKNQGKKVYLLGNIGTPVFDDIDEIEDDSIVVLELSSHALQYLKKSTEIAILLNIYEEHLDHYKDFDEYINAKLNIFKNQANTGIAIFNADNKNIKYKFKQNDYGITLKGERITNNTFELKENEIFFNNKKIFKPDKNKMLLKG